MDQLDGAEVIRCTDAVQWESWLGRHHDRVDGVWVKIAKKASGVASVTPAEAVEVALCFGWIDSLRRSLDDTHFLQKYTRRRPRGAWSRINVELVEALQAAGRMRPAGLAEVEAAKADGRWVAAYESQKRATVPDDLDAALTADPKAREFFESLGRSDQYAVILRLLKARTPESRATGLSRMIATMAAGRRIDEPSG